ncbi:MAG TPA: MmoB/DmpM family protein [Candidatus Acidoferrum sp.]|nr:MmoB/DmpM family protein [Candidatus Acidoferrum sp.]
MTSESRVEGRAERVGPVLEPGELTDAILDAIREDNPSVETEDRESYIRVLVPSRCVLSRQAVERRIGRPFRLPGDLEQVMPSFKGQLTMNGEEAVWAVGLRETSR